MGSGLGLFAAGFEEGDGDPVVSEVGSGDERISVGGWLVLGAEADAEDDDGGVVGGSSSVRVSLESVVDGRLAEGGREVPNSGYRGRRECGLISGLGSVVASCGSMSSVVSSSTRVPVFSDGLARSSGSLLIRSWIHMAVDCNFLSSCSEGLCPKAKTVLMRNCMSSSMVAVAG